MMRTRTFALAFAIAALVALAIPGVAMANFAIHGNYVADTDACAGCHRAHTSFSSITWTDVNDNEHSALLVSSATEMYQFCYACHDATGQGADTNVQEGIYEGSLYGTNGATLNGGGTEFMPSFDATLGINVNVPTTSEHEFRGSSWGAFGGGYFGGRDDGDPLTPDGQISGSQAGESVDIKMDCATCHDPHGSPNYRILKTQVNGNPVGKYVGTGTDPDPDGYVSSVETGWPAGGFRLHTAYPDYKPNYTTPRYAKGYDMTTGAVNDAKGMSGWCAGCHETYLADPQIFTKADGTPYRSVAATYNAGDGGGLRLRHKHPINVPLSNYEGPDAASMIVTASVLPLAHSLDESSSATPANTSGDWIDCLTCHRAHGTIANMTGYAADGSLPVDVDGVSRNNFVGDPSALLRMDNRGVCEACHNK